MQRSGRAVATAILLFIFGHEFGPYDVIHVGAACSSIPEILVEQLKPGGALLAPVGPPNAFQHLKLLRKDEEGTISVEECGRVSYCPLVSRQKQCPPSPAYHNYT